MAEIFHIFDYEGVSLGSVIPISMTDIAGMSPSYQLSLGCSDFLCGGGVDPHCFRRDIPGSIDFAKCLRGYAVMVWSATF
jgi:hypothetical protein